MSTSRRRQQASQATEMGTMIEFKFEFFFRGVQKRVEHRANPDPIWMGKALSGPMGVGLQHSIENAGSNAGPVELGLSKPNNEEDPSPVSIMNGPIGLKKGFLLRAIHLGVGKGEILV